MNKRTCLMVIAFSAVIIHAQANMKEMVKYKGAFPEGKAKCNACHTKDLPKKDDGQHDLNAYGKAVMKAAGGSVTSSETYKTVGTVEDFSKKGDI